MTETTLTDRFEAAFAALPLVAILRGLAPDDAVAICRALYDAGFRCLEIPLNSPQPFDSIARVRADLPADALVGAGTVTTTEAVARLAEIGAELVVMPHADTEVIGAAKAAGLISVPGVATPTRGLCGAGGGGRCAEDLPGGTGGATGDQGDARGAAQGHAAVAGGRHHPGDHDPVPRGRGGRFRSWQRVVPARRQRRDGQCQCPRLHRSDGQGAGLRPRRFDDDGLGGAPAPPSDWAPQEATCALAPRVRSTWRRPASPDHGCP